ncbi:MAG: hypothetical protein KIS92_00885 [Planctomycetota bacterium]|nr:hypothetical protein [Planctomycetota bacterium]
MPTFSDAEKEKVFQVFGVPRGGTGFEVVNLSSIFGPAGETYDFSAVVTALNARIDAADAVAERRALVQAQLADWDAVTPQSELEVYAGAGNSGVLAHDARRRENIRMTIADLLGFVCPRGGFSREIQRRRRCHRILR